MAGIKKPLGNKAYDSDPFRKRSAGRHHTRDPGSGKSQDTHPSREASPQGPLTSSSAATARFKDFRRIATRCHKLDRTLFCSVCPVAAVIVESGP
jgi:hypothetical protein